MKLLFIFSNTYPKVLESSQYLICYRLLVEVNQFSSPLLLSFLLEYYLNLARDFDWKIAKHGNYRTWETSRNSSMSTAVINSSWELKWIKNRKYSHLLPETFRASILDRSLEKYLQSLRCCYSSPLFFFYPATSLRESCVTSNLVSLSSIFFLCRSCLVCQHTWWHPPHLSAKSKISYHFRV